MSGLLEPLENKVQALAIAQSENSVFRWARVTQVSPLRIILPGDADPVSIDIDSLFEDLRVGDRVRVETKNDIHVVHGRAHGAPFGYFDSRYGRLVPHLRGTTAQRLALEDDGLVVEGTQFDDTTENTHYVWSSGAWKSVLVPSYVADALTAMLIPYQAWALLAQNSEPRWDEHLIDWGTPDWTANGLRIPRSGRYLVTLSMLVTSVNIRYIAGVGKNANGVPNPNPIVTAQSTGFSGWNAVSVSRQLDLVAGDRLVPIAFADGPSGPYGVTPDGTHFAVTMLRG